MAAQYESHGTYRSRISTWVICTERRLSEIFSRNVGGIYSVQINAAGVCAGADIYPQGLAAAFTSHIDQLDQYARILERNYEYHVYCNTLSIREEMLTEK